jgi:hypothetical protein
MANATCRRFAACAYRGGVSVALPKIDFEAVQWSQVVEGFLQSIAGVERHLNALNIGVENGDMQALLIRANGQNCGVLIWSVEHDLSGPVIVANAVAGSLPGVNLTIVCINFLVEAGRASGAKSVRAFTDRPGLVRKCEAVGMKARFMIEGTI